MKLRKLSTLLAIFGLGDAAVVAPLDHITPHPNLTEASTNFDLTDIEPFFKTLCPLFEGGFGEREVAEVKKLAEKTPIEKQAEIEFAVKFEGETVRMYVRILMDDVDSPDVYVFAPNRVTEAVQAKMAEYSDALGR